MTELKQLFDELADDAKTYDVVALAEKKAREQRWVVPAAAAGVAVVALTAGGIVVANALGSTPQVVAGPSDSPTGQPSVTGSADPTAPPTGPTQLPPPVGCAATVLPTPAGYPPTAIVTGGDPTGRFLIGRTGFKPALLWDRTAVTAINVPGSEVSPVDVNSSGQVVIEAWFEDATYGAYLYDHGNLTRLAGDYVDAQAINSSGVVVGSILVHVSNDSWVRRPAVWTSPGAQPQLLGPGSLEGYAVGIDDDGTITVWTNGTSILRFPPDGSSIGGGDGIPVTPPVGFTPNQVRAYNNGWLSARDDSGAGAGNYVWNLSTGQVYPQVTYADALNAQGSVALSLSPFPGPDPGFDPTGTTYVVATDGTVTNLARLDDGTYDHYALVTQYLSDDGRTVAGQGNGTVGAASDADPVPVVWNCP